MLTLHRILIAAVFQTIILVHGRFNSQGKFLSNLLGGYDSTLTAANSIEIKNSIVTDTNAAHHLSRAWRYQHISFENCAVNSTVMEPILGNSIHNASEVRSLSIIHSGLSDETLSSCMSKSSGSRNLRVLNLSFNKFDVKSHRYISSLLGRLSGLVCFAFDGNPLSPDDMRSLVHSIRRHESLRVLSLSSCAIDDDSLGLLSFGLKCNGNISFVDISSNRITSDGMSALSAALKSEQGKKLEYLDLSYNCLGDDGVNAITRLLETNQLPSLRSLILKQVGATSVSVERLLRALHNDSSLHHLDLSGNQIMARSKVSKYSGGRGGLAKLANKMKLDTFTSKMSVLSRAGLDKQMKSLSSLSSTVTNSMSTVFSRVVGKSRTSGSKNRMGRRPLLPPPPPSAFAFASKTKNQIKVPIALEKVIDSKRKTNGMLKKNRKDSIDRQSGTEQKNKKLGAQSRSKLQPFSVKFETSKRLGRDSLKPMAMGKSTPSVVSKGQAIPTATAEEEEDIDEKLLRALLKCARSMARLQELSLVQVGLTAESGAKLVKLSKKMTKKADNKLTSSAEPSEVSEIGFDGTNGHRAIQVHVELNDIDTSTEESLVAAIQAVRAHAAQ